MLRIVVLSILLVFLNSCDITKNNVFAPNKRIFKQMPEGPVDYQQGWMDGCETGMSTGFGNDYYKTFYKFKKDVNMVKAGNKRYTRAWSSAMIFCRHYVLGTLVEAGMKPILPGNGFPLPLHKDSILGNAINPNTLGAHGISKW